jgi:hypothetical protein
MLNHEDRGAEMLVRFYHKEKPEPGLWVWFAVHWPTPLPAGKHEFVEGRRLSDDDVEARDGRRIEARRVKAWSTDQASLAGQVRQPRPM